MRVVDHHNVLQSFVSKFHNYGNAIGSIASQTIDFGARDFETLGTIPNHSGNIETASITGGSVQSKFTVNSTTGKLTVSAIGDGDITSGDVQCDYTIDGVVYSVVFTINPIANAILIEPSNAQLLSAYNAIPLTGGEIRIRDGVTVDTVRQAISTRDFSSEILITSHGYVASPNIDRRNSIRPARMKGLTFEAGCKNITVKGIEWQLAMAGAETSGTHGVITVEAPSTNIKILDCEIWSTNLAEERLAGNLVNYSTSPLLLRGIFVKSSAASPAANYEVRNNYIRDVERGVVLKGGTDFWFTSNLIFDLYTNPWTVGGEAIDTMYGLNNLGMHVWASTDDTTGGPGTEPHSAAGGSFDAPTSPDFVTGMNWAGNWTHVGWNRKKLEVDNALSVSPLASTGWKLNNPGLTDSYRNSLFYDNGCIASGISFQVIGGDGVYVTNHTLVRDHYNSGGSPPNYDFVGAANTRIWNSLGPAYAIGADDGGTNNGQAMVESLLTMTGYGNQTLVSTDPADNYTGVPAGNFDFLDPYDVPAAYTPLAGSHAATNKIGANTGYWLNSYTMFAQGTWPAFAVPAATGGTPVENSLTTWDGSTNYASMTTLQNGGLDIAAGKVGTFAFEFEMDSSVDSSGFNLIRSAGSTIWISVMAAASDNALRVRLKNAAGDVVLDAKTKSSFTSADGLVRATISIDLANERCLFTKNGVPEVYPTITEMVDDDIGWGTPALVYLYAGETGSHDNKFAGNNGVIWFDPIFIDTETISGLEDLYASTGAFLDFGATGSVPTGSQSVICFKGNAATLDADTGNGGDGGTITMVGNALIDVSTGPNEVAFRSGDYTDDLGITAGPDLLIAARVRVKSDNTDTFMFCDTTANTYWGFVWDGNGGKFFARYEQTTGTVLAGLQSTTTFDITDAEYSVLVLMTDGVQELWVDGVLEDSDTVTYSNNVKPPKFINDRNGDGLNTQSFDLVGGITVFNAINDGAGGDDLQYSDFFDGSNQPVFGGDLQGVTPAWEETGDAAAWNALAEMNGTVADV